MVGSLIRKVCSSVFPFFHCTPQHRQLSFSVGGPKIGCFGAGGTAIQDGRKGRFSDPDQPRQHLDVSGNLQKVQNKSTCNHTHPIFLCSSIHLKIEIFWRNEHGQVTQMVSMQTTIITLRQTGRFETLKVTLLSFSILTQQ